ncbi:putative G-protein coupled receptor 139 [Rhinoraja longicauda]
MKTIVTDYSFFLLPSIIQAEMIYYPIIAVFGILANVISIVILSRGKCGLSKCVSRYLVAMAAGDLLVAVIDVLLYRINHLYFPTTFLFITQVCSFHRALNHAVTDISVWLTLSFTFDRYLMICGHKLRSRFCTEKTAASVIATVCTLFCFKNIPWYFAFEPVVTLHNVAWGCYIKQEFYTATTWISFTWIHRCFSPLLPMFLISLLNALTVGHILMASRVRKNLRGSKNGANQNDAEMESRRKSVILLFAISGNFIVLWMTYFIFFLCLQITKRFYSTGYSDPFFIADETSYMLLLLSYCTNTCIYAVTQSKFRKELKSGLKYLPIIMFKRVKEGSQCRNSKQ